MLTNKKILGVIGGMGPHATLTFFEKFIKYNKYAQIDQDHFPLYICNDPEIPDRTESIINHRTHRKNESQVIGVWRAQVLGMQHKIIKSLTYMIYII